MGRASRSRQCEHLQTTTVKWNCAHGVERWKRICDSCNRRLEHHHPCEKCAEVAAKKALSRRPGSYAYERTKRRAARLREVALCEEIGHEELTSIVPLSSPIRGVVDSVMALEPGQCRYPIGDPKADNFRFCLHPVLQGSSYCAAHHFHLNEQE